jgi:hypothetical protein
VPHLFHQQTTVLLVGSNKMTNVYRVKFLNWKNGQDEYFFQYELDADLFANKYKKYGYTPVVETIYMQEVGASI